MKTRALVRASSLFVVLGVGCSSSQRNTGDGDSSTPPIELDAGKGDTSLHDGGSSLDARRAGDAPPLNDSASQRDAGVDAPLPEAPTLKAPLSTSHVTSRTPTLHWTLPGGVTSVTVDLCSDRTCASPIGTSTHVTGSSYAPAADLPSGVVYWRVHPGTVTAVTSATWEFSVGARSAPVDTSWGTTFDVNGDGFADVVVGADTVSSKGAAYVYLGSANGPGASADTTLTAPSDGTFGSSVASAGDVNGDGYADLIVGDASGGAYLYLGGPSGVATSPTALSNPAGAGVYFGGSVAGAGDVNGDGFADVIVGAPGVASGAGSVYLYLGSSAGIGTTPATTLSGVDGDNGAFGTSVASAGDINGDGYADIIVGASGAGNTAGSAYVYLGGASGLSTAPSLSLNDPPLTSIDQFGAAVAGAGDVNGDGYADFVVGAFGTATQTGAAYVYLGAQHAVATTPATTLKGLVSEDQFGFSVSGAGDVDGDGYGDLLIAAPSAFSSLGSAYVFLGSASGIVAASVVTMSDPNRVEGDEFGLSSAAAGDINGDGHADLILGSQYATDSAGAAYLYFGSAHVITVAADAGNGPTPSITLNGPAGPFANFGSSVFGSSD